MAMKDPENSVGGFTESKDRFLQKTQDEMGLFFFIDLSSRGAVVAVGSGSACGGTAEGLAARGVGGLAVAGASAVARVAHLAAGGHGDEEGHGHHHHGRAGAVAAERVGEAAAVAASSEHGERDGWKGMEK